MQCQKVSFGYDNSNDIAFGQYIGPDNKYKQINIRNDGIYGYGTVDGTFKQLWQAALKSDLYYKSGNIENFKGITFTVKKNFNLVSLSIGGQATSAINANDLIGNLQEFAKPASYIEFLIYDIKNNVVYSMSIDVLMAVRAYGGNIPLGAQLRGMVTYFASNT